MRLPEFADAWARVDRAAEHRERFKLAEEAWFETRPHHFMTEFDPDTGKHVKRLKVAPIVPPTIGAIITDAIHNLRAALDYLAYSIAVVDSGQNPPPRHKKLAFPIAETSEEFDRKANTCRGDLRDVIWAAFKAFQPFETDPDAPTESSLWFLEEMDLIGKHRHLPTTTTVMGDQLTFRKTTPESVIRVDFPFLGPLEDDTPFLTYTADAPGQVEVELDTTFAIAFGKWHGLPEGEPVGQIIDRFKTNVEIVLSSFPITRPPLT